MGRSRLAQEWAPVSIPTHRDRQSAERLGIGPASDEWRAKADSLTPASL